MRNSLLLLLLALLVSSLFWAGSTRAEDWDYRTAIDAAVEAYKLDRFDEAYALFSKAHTLQPSARTLRGMGLAAFEIRRYGDSIRYLTAALDDARMPLNAALRNEAEKLIRTASTFVVRLELSLNPADAELSVDGQVVERDPKNPILLDPGAHQLVAKASGYQVAIRSVEWPPGTQTKLELRLVPEAASAPVETPAAPEPSSGLQQTASGAPSAPVDGNPGGAVRVLKWVMLGTTLASVAVTGLAVGLREHKARQLHSCEQGGDTSCSSLSNSASAWRTTAIAAGVTGAALAVTTAVLFVVDRKKKSAATQALRSCHMSVGSVGLQCQIAF